MSTPRPGPDAAAEAAFTAMVAATLPRVTAYARRRVRDPDDVVAEVYATAWRHRDRLPDPALPWLLKAASHHVLHDDRSEMRRRALGERTAGAATPEPDHAPGVAARLDAATRVERALARLSDLDREVLRLTAWEQLTPGEVAVVLGCSATAAKVRLHRARRRLAAALVLTDHAPTDRRPGARRADPTSEVTT